MLFDMIFNRCLVTTDTFLYNLHANNTLLNWVDVPWRFLSNTHHVLRPSESRHLSSTVCWLGRSHGLWLFNFAFNVNLMLNFRHICCEGRRSITCLMSVACHDTSGKYRTAVPSGLSTNTHVITCTFGAKMRPSIVWRHQFLCSWWRCPYRSSWVKSV